MPTEMMHGQVVTEIRFIAESDGGLFELCSVGFSERDTSLYLRPVAPTGHFFAGMWTLPAGVPSMSFPLRGQTESEPPRRLKLSIHACGQVHAKFDGDRGEIAAGPLSIPPLSASGGQHIATLAVDNFAHLQAVSRSLTTDGKKVDFAFPFGEHSSGRIAFYANAAEPRFADATHYFTLHRPDSGDVLYLGVAGTPQEPLGSPSSGGLTLISGWNPLVPRTDISQDCDFLFLRGT